MMGCHVWVDRWAVGEVAAYCACRVGCCMGIAGWVVYTGRFGCYASMASIFGVGGTLVRAVSVIRSVMLASLSIA